MIREGSVPVGLVNGILLSCLIWLFILEAVK